MFTAPGALLGGVRAHTMEGLLEASHEWTHDAQVATVPFLVTFAARLPADGRRRRGPGRELACIPGHRSQFPHCGSIVGPVPLAVA